MINRSTRTYIMCAALAAATCLPLVGCNKNGTSDNGSPTPTPTPTSTLPATSATPSPTPTPTK